MKKSLLCIVAVGMLASPLACNYTDGACWPRGESPGSGAGGGPVIISSGTGPYGHTPRPQPQDVTGPPPDCNIVQQDPCHEKCETDYALAAAKCGRIPDPVQRRACQDAAYPIYKSCGAVCDQQIADCKDRCKKQCDKIHDRCHADCTKNDPTSTCHAKCNNEYADCLRECDRDCG
jgi:hypothetical protein